MGRGWAARALYWGVGGLAAAFDAPGLTSTDRGEPPRPAARRTRRIGPVLAAVLAALAITGALYGLAPLWALLGLRPGVTTVLGLFALALVAWLVDSVTRRRGGR